VQADSIVPQPGNPQALNRYSCVNNNPLRYVDPSGHYIQLEDEPEFAVRITGDGTIRVLRGGLWLRNAQELAWANYFLAGSSGPMPSLPGGVFGSTIVGSASNAAYAIGGQRAASSSGELVRDPLFIAGLAHMVGKAVETTFDETGAIAGNIAQRMLQQAATQADASVSGSGPQAGTAKHSVFRGIVQTWQDSQLQTEQSFYRGDPVRWGYPGSVRLDVVEYDDKGAITAVYDYKSGGATLTPARIQQIGSHLPKDALTVPVIEIRGW